MKQNIKAFWTLLQREVWQNYKTWFFWTLGISASVVFIGTMLDKSVHEKNSIELLRALLGTIVELGPFILNTLFLGYLYSFVSKDHEHNNLSFWRSLPPDDGWALVAKLATALITLPLVVTIVISLLWVVLAVFGGLTVIIANQIHSSHEVNAVTEVMKMLNPLVPLDANLIEFLSKDLLLYWPIRALWLAPFVCLLMLAQTILKRNGSILVIVAVSSLSAVEVNYLDSHYINTFTVEHLRYGAHSSNLKKTQTFFDYEYEDFKLRKEPKSKRLAAKAVAEVTWINAPENYLSKMNNWSFSFGLILSALFFTLSVWIRKRQVRF
jgi:hypothetical protein